jgi:hypothetical protein
MNEIVIKNGDIWDIGQTVNGVSRFVFIDNIWYYYGKWTSHELRDHLNEYQYGHGALTEAIMDDARLGFDECKCMGNFLDLVVVK